MAKTHEGTETLERVRSQDSGKNKDTGVDNDSGSR